MQSLWILRTTEGETTMKKTLLTGVAVLFLATGATHAEDALVLLGDESNPSYYTIVNSPWSCLETLERHLANQENGTWLSWQSDGEKTRHRIWNVICTIGTSNQCVAGKSPDGKAC